jgi:hypothetical protein
MFRLEIIGDRAVVARIDRLPAALRAKLEVQVRYLAIKLQSWIQQRKLQGQVLRHQTGALSRSIQQDVKTTASAVVGMVFSAGDVKYARFWELGFTGVEQVKAHMRTVTQVFGRSVPAKTQSVRAHDRKVDQAPRPFMRPSLVEMTPEIKKRLRDTVIGTTRDQVLGGRRP